MADIHLQTGGSNTSPYETWAKAATTWATAVSGMIAGDRLLVDSAFAAASAGVSLTFPGTPASPNEIYSGTPASGSGLSALVRGAILATSNSTFSVTGTIYVNGVNSEAQSNTSTEIRIGTANGNVQIWENCGFRIVGTGTGGLVNCGGTGSASSTSVKLINPEFRFAAAANRITTHGDVEIQGGSFHASTVSPTNAFIPFAQGRGGKLLVYGFDFTNLASSFNITSVGIEQGGQILFANFKLPASWTGAYQAGTARAGLQAEFYGGDSGDIRYRFHIVAGVVGTLREDTATHVTGSVTDDGTISDRFSATANIKFPLGLRGRWYYKEVTNVGSARTATIRCARLGSTTRYQNNQVWMEIEFFGTNGTSLGKSVSSRLVDTLNGTPATWAEDFTAWTGVTGSDCKFEVTAAFTPQEIGYVRARIVFAVTSATDLYVNPSVEIT